MQTKILPSTALSNKVLFKKKFNFNTDLRCIGISLAFHLKQTLLKFFLSFFEATCVTTSEQPGQFKTIILLNLLCLFKGNKPSKKQMKDLWCCVSEEIWKFGVKWVDKGQSNYYHKKTVTFWVSALHRSIEHRTSNLKGHRLQSKHIVHLLHERTHKVRVLLPFYGPSIFRWVHHNSQCHSHNHFKYM